MRSTLSSASILQFCKAFSGSPSCNCITVGILVGYPESIHRKWWMLVLKNRSTIDVKSESKLFKILYQRIMHRQENRCAVSDDYPYFIYTSWMNILIIIFNWNIRVYRDVILCVKMIFICVLMAFAFIRSFLHH